MGILFGLLSLSWLPQFLPKILNFVVRWVASRIIRNLEKDLADEKHKSAALEDELHLFQARVAHRFGQGDAPIELTNTFINEDRLRYLESDAVHYKLDDFYAISTDKDPDWYYEETTEFELLQLDRQVLSESDLEIVESIPLHLWRNNKTIHLTGLNIVPEQPIYACVIVQRIPIPKFMAVVEWGFRQQFGDESIGITEKDLDRLWEQARVSFEIDPLGSFLSQQSLLPIVASQDPAISLIFSSIREQGTHLSAKYKTAFNKVYVDGEMHRQYFVFHNLHLMGTPGSVWLVKTVVPTGDRRSEDFSWIGNWLSHFAIPGRN